MTVRTLTLPDGTDLTDARVQARVEARVRSEWGDGWAAMWPRYPDVVDGVPPVLPVVEVRPAAKVLTLPPTIRPADAPKVAVQAERMGAGTMIAFDPHRREAVAAQIDPDALAIRGRLAELLKVQPWDVEVVVHRVDDAKTGENRLDQVVIWRAPATGIAAEKRRQTWADLMLTFPGGSTGWQVIEDPVSGRVTLRYGKPRTLPGKVPTVELLPDRLNPSGWAELPLGVSPEGRKVGVDLTLGPHTLLVGPTGSGKTVALLQLVSSALTHGHRVVMIDPTKAGLDFLQVKDWCAGWADELLGAQAMVEAVYAEVQRRKKVLQEYGEVKWSDLPLPVREKTQIYPTLVVIDEFGSLVIQEDIPKSLPKDHEFRVEAEERNVARAVISSLVGRIAREARFAGLHLALALQRPDASIVGGELRSNLTSAVQLAAPGKPISLDALRMVFPGEVAPIAAETLAELDDGHSRGLAVMAADGGAAHGFRVGYARPQEIPPMLEEVGVPKPEKWKVGKPATTDAAGQFGAVVETPDIVDLPPMEISLEDLERESNDDDDPGNDSPGSIWG